SGDTTFSLNTTGNLPGVPVSPAVTTQFLVSGFPTPAATGAAGVVTVTAADASGNPSPGYTGTIHFTSSDPNAVLPQDTTLINGTGTFSVTFQTAGTQSLTVSDATNAT